MKELEIKVKWENGAMFSVVEKHDEHDPTTVLALEENGEIAVLWPNVQKALEAYWKVIMTKIGEEMKA
jgi:hypothetical protein